MDCFTIKDLENLTGIKAHTIRIWEQRYGFLKPCRTCTNIRYYSNDELKKLLNIALLNKYGYRISQIDKMTDEELQEKIILLTQAQAQQEKLINDLIKDLIDLNIESIEDALDSYIASRGIERTITQIIFPFLERIGILWLTDHINPAQEHLVSNLIRQKLIVGIESIITSLKVDKKVLLFLPENEHHELGLLFISYLLKSRGIGVIYLGANISLQDVEYVVKIKQPDYIYCHLTSTCSNFNFDKFIHCLTEKFKGIPSVISGRLTTTYERKIPSGVAFKKSINEVMEFIVSLDTQYA